MNRTVTIARFAPVDLATMAVQAVQTELAGDRLALGQSYDAMGRCFTVRWAGTDDVVMCAGALESHAGYVTLWASLAPGARRAMPEITRAVALFVSRLDHRRVDTNVRSDHAAGHRWVHRLGFVPEARLNDYYSDGGDAVIYRLKR